MQREWRERDGVAKVKGLDGMIEETDDGVPGGNNGRWAIASKEEKRPKLGIDGKESAEVREKGEREEMLKLPGRVFEGV